jgi:uncharacterized protein (DUF952 family)
VWGFPDVGEGGDEMDDREPAAGGQRRPTGVALHLTPSVLWERQRLGPTYLPEGFDREGFVHCTDGTDRLLVPANAHYRHDPRRFVVLEVDLDQVLAPIRYDDEARIYPHIYGPIDTAAVVGLRRAERAGDGTFTAFPPA